MAQKSKSFLVNISVTLLLLCSAGFFGWKFLSELTREVENIGGIRVGAVAVVQGQAERRFQQQTRWIGIQTDETVYNLDAIRTTADSSAIIELDYENEAGEKQKEEVVLGPNTYIVFDLLGEKRNILLVSGDLSATGTGELTISAGDTVVSVDDGSVNLERQEGVETLVTVFQGEIRVNAGGVETHVDSQAALRVNDDSGVVGREEVAVTSLVPRPNALLLSYAETLNVSFSWNLQADWENPVLEISANAQFNENEFQTTRIPASGRATQKLGTGQWYWRIADSRSGASSPANMFTVDTENQVLLSSPGSDSELSFRDDVPPVNFQWTRASYADAYLVEISRDSSIREPVISREVSGGSLLVDNLEEGRWWWRVTPRYHRGILDTTQGTEPRSFIFKKLAGHEATRLISPPDGLVFSSLDVSEGIPFSWHAAKKDSTYTVSVAQDSAFTNILATAENERGLALLLPSPPPATYYWRVEAISADDQPIPVSETRHFTVRNVVDVVELLNPAPGETRELEPYTPFEFRWRSRIQGTQRLQLQRVNESVVGGRESIIDALVLGERFTTLLPGSGAYIWSLQVLDDAERVLARSDVGRFQIRLELIPPQLNAPLPGSTVQLTNLAALRLSWNPATGADAYRVVLRDPHGSIIAQDNQVIGLSREFALTNTPIRGSYIAELTSLRNAPSDSSLVESTTALYRFGVDIAQQYSVATPIYPNDGAIFQVESAILNDVTLRWEQNPPPESYIIKITNTGETQAYLTTEPQLTLNNLDVGTYTWLVQSRDRLGEASSESKTVGFQVKSLPVPESPTIIFPVSGQDIDMTHADNLEFQWEAVSDDAFYNLALYVEGEEAPFWNKSNHQGTSFILDDLTILDVGSFVLTMQTHFAAEGVNPIRMSPVSRVPFSLSIDIAEEAPQILTEELQYVY